MAAKGGIENGKIESISIGLGSVAPTVIRALKTETLLIRSTISPMLLEQARQTISQEVKPISDVRSTEDYRRIVTGNLLLKFLRQLI
jgi:aerobic carbon-monoxide dehydrogenase medium subunit